MPHFRLKKQKVRILHLECNYTLIINELSVYICYIRVIRVPKINNHHRKRMTQILLIITELSV